MWLAFVAIVRSGFAVTAQRHVGPGPHFLCGALSRPWEQCFRPLAAGVAARKDSDDSFPPTGLLAQQTAGRGVSKRGRPYPSEASGGARGRTCGARPRS
jgi:hypothetical protein